MARRILDAGHEFVVYGEFVPGVQDAARHTFTHSAKTDETYFHCDDVLLYEELRPETAQPYTARFFTVKGVLT